MRKLWHLPFLFDGPWRGLPETGICLDTDHPEDWSVSVPCPACGWEGPGPRSCGQPVVGPAFQGPAWHVGNVLGEVSAFQKLKGKCSYMGWWVVGGGVCGNVLLVWNPEGLQLRVTLGLCHARELTCFSDVFINRDLPYLPCFLVD